MKKILFFVLIALCPNAAQAINVTMNIFAARLYNQNGSPLPENSAVTLLVDVDRDGFGDLTQALNTFKGDADDILVGGSSRPSSFDSNGGDPFAFVVDSYNVSLPDAAEGAPMMLVWYNRPWLPIQNGPGRGVFFGTFTDPSWVVGGDGSTLPYEFLTVATGLGSFPESRAFATQVTTVPEPSSALVALSVGGFLAARRRRAA